MIKTFTSNYNVLKRELAVLLLLIFTLSFNSEAFSQHTLTIDDVVFDSATGTITDYTATYSDIIIPASFNVDGADIPVDSIGPDSFWNKALTSVVISEGIKVIGSWSFYENKISSVEIPSSVTRIVEGAFNSNEITTVNGEASNGLVYDRKDDGTVDRTSIISYGGASDVIDFIPDEVTKIRAYAFFDTGITSINLPSGLTCIEMAAFNKNNAITTVNGQASNGIFYARKSDGTEDRSVIVSYGGATVDIDFIPEGVEVIGDYAFSASKLKSIELPNSIKKIGDYSIAYNHNIESISFGSNIEYFGEGAFKDDHWDSFTIPNTVSFIGKYVFAGNDMTSVLLPDPVVKDMEGYSFKNWTDSNGKVVTEIEDFDAAYTANFELTGYVVSGSVTIDDTEGLVLKVTGDITETVDVNDDGSYSFALDAGRSVVITPEKEGYAFDPKNISINNIQENKIKQDFTAGTPTAIHGQRIYDIAVYPNPVTDVLTVETKGDCDKVLIMAITGNVVNSVDCAEQNIVKLNMSGLAPGIYIVKMTGANRSVVKKILKR